jgi:predicted ArsR family transcriptional regulator
MPKGFNNAQKAAQTKAAIIAALAASGDDGMTTGEIKQVVASSEETVRGHINRLRFCGEVHVGRFKLIRGKLTSCYVLGAGDDAKIGDYSYLLEDGAEQEAHKEVERKHAKWARDWKAHRPLEAAWI